MIVVIALKMEQFWFYNTVNRPNDVYELANSVDLDQTAPQEQSGLCHHSLLKPIRSNT